MADPNLADFQGRLRRIEQTRRKGGGFEATGALGRAHFTPRRQRRLPILGPVLVVAMAVTGLKALIHAQVGADVYDARVAGLLAGEGVDPVGGFIMQADPLTLYLSGKLVPLLHLH